MHPAAGYTAPPPTSATVIRSMAHIYDLMAWVLLRGRERALRERMIDLAGLKSGETVLDVGCGTGTLLIATKRRVGIAGRAYGIDPSRQMIAIGVYGMPIVIDRNGWDVGNLGHLSATDRGAIVQSARSIQAFNNAVLASEARSGTGSNSPKSSLIAPVASAA